MNKSVTFDESKNEVHIMYVWTYAYKKSRMLPQEFINQQHFKRRIELCEIILKPILTVNYRKKF